MKDSTKRPSAVDPHREIAAQLRALYAQVESEPIPAGLIELLERLDQAEIAEHGKAP